MGGGDFQKEFGEWLHLWEAKQSHYLCFRILLQHSLSRLWLQFPFEHSTLYLGEEDTVQLISLGNSQLPVSLGEVFFLAQSKRPHQVLLLQAMEGPQKAAALSGRLREKRKHVREGRCDKHGCAHTYTPHHVCSTQTHTSGVQHAHLQYIKCMHTLHWVCLLHMCTVHIHTGTCMSVHMCCTYSYTVHTHMPEHAHMEHTCAHTHTLSQADKDRSNLPSLLSEYLSRTITEQKFTGVEMCKLKALEDSLHGRNENLFSTGGSRS